LTYQEVFMEQHETLFETHCPAWRVEIRLKAGGGPFDPAGFSLQIITPGGGLHGLVVRKEETTDEPFRQLTNLAAQVMQALDEKLAEQIKTEMDAWRITHRSR
jgi:hypothetical protein